MKPHTDLPEDSILTFLKIHSFNAHCSLCPNCLARLYTASNIMANLMGDQCFKVTLKSFLCAFGYKISNFSNAESAQTM